MERRIDISPAFDRRDPNPKKNYGIHGVEMRFLLLGEAGVVQFLLFTNWMLPHVQQEAIETYDFETFVLLTKPMPADLGYHSPVPRYEGQEPMGPCEYLDGKLCYYDGSSLNAEPVFELLIREGGEAMWKKLEAYYRATFESGE